MLLLNIFFILFVPIITNGLDDETVKDIKGNHGLTPFQIAKKYNYPIERHRIATEDGYIIEIHRIPYGVNSTNRLNRPAVVIAHGAGGTSVEFFMMGHRSLGFALVEAGYDVWVGNARGTRWSRSHQKLSTSSKQFWMFSWEEIGVYDYSAEINYIINVTGEKKVFFIGHSQGASAFIGMNTERPEMNDKIRLGVLIGPAVITKFNRNPLILVVSENIEAIRGLLDYLRIYEIPSGPMLISFLRNLCTSVFAFICQAYLNLTMGYDSIQIDRRIYDVAVSNLPGGLSFRQLLHYAQMYNSKRFQKFDYGPEGNMQHYGTLQPPEYNISKVTAPIAVMYSEYDTFADVKGVQALIKLLPNCVFDYKIDRDMWNHVAFLAADDANMLVNDKIIEMFSQY